MGHADGCYEAVPILELIQQPTGWRWWGTCVDCPRDQRGVAYSWQCINRDRYDHRLERKGP